MKENVFFNPVSEQIFVMFSASHMISIVIFIAIVAALFTLRRHIRDSRVLQNVVRCVIIASLLVPEAVLNLWYVSVDMWDMRYSLPLELCSITLILSVVMMLSRSYLLYQILFFAGIGGAVQAIVTPNLFYSFPHFRFFHFFSVHIGIILAVLYMTWIEQYRPTFKSIAVAMIFLNAALVAVGGLDIWLDANYMFLMHKPDTASIIDFLGPYPYYLISLELFAAAVFLLMYVPVMVERRRKAAAG